MSPKLTVLLVIFFLHSHTLFASDPDPVQDFCIPNTKPGSISSARFTSLACKNSSEASPDDFVFSGIKVAGNFKESGFSAKSVTPTLFPGLNTLGMSFVRADLDVGGINVPHFHPRATEIALVVEGRVYSGFVDSANRLFSKVIEKGEVMVFPRGLVHFQMNVGDSPATIYGSFNSQNPGLQRISTAVFGSGIKEELLEKAFGLSAKQLRVMRRKLIPKVRVMHSASHSRYQALQAGTNGYSQRCSLLGAASPAGPTPWNILKDGRLFEAPTFLLCLVSKLENSSFLAPLVALAVVQEHEVGDSSTAEALFDCSISNHFLCKTPKSYKLARN